MQDYIGHDAVEQLQHAWREAAFGGPDYSEQLIRGLREKLDQAQREKSTSEASEKAVRSYMEAARIAAEKGESLGVVLPLIAALEELERTGK
jgi:hypothetical protein